MDKACKVLVTGGGGLLGSRLIISLAGSGYQITGLGRGKCPAELQSICEWLSFDLVADQQIQHNTDILIHCAPLWLLPDFLQNLQRQANIRRCIAMSSTSAIAKAKAMDHQDRDLARRLLDAENKIKGLTADNISTTILRPTLIYGYGKDKNITVIANFIKKFGFFPVAGKAVGLRQPVHVDDLVKAIIDIIENPRAYSKTYNLGGVQTMTYRAMVEKIFLKLGRSPRIVGLPLPLYRLLLAIRNSGYSPGSADRMNQNLDYDIEPAIADFNYRPQGFLQNPRQDLC